MNIISHSPEHPPCEVCAKATRLVAIEPHPDLPEVDLSTLECLVCSHVQVVQTRVVVNGRAAARMASA